MDTIMILCIFLSLHNPKLVVEIGKYFENCENVIIVLGAQKNHLYEMDLLGTQNVCFVQEIEFFNWKINDFLMLSFLLQLAKTFFNLMSHIAKDQTLQYILTMLDDVLQVNKSRV